MLPSELIEKLLERSKTFKRVDPEGNEYRSKQIVGASNGHWRVEYCYQAQGGYTYKYFWEVMEE